MAGNKIGVQMCLDDVLDDEAIGPSFFKVQVDVALRVNNCSLSIGADEVRGMGQTF
jgi:hypothetical protein